MIKSYIVDSTFNNMRFDRWLRIKLGKVPQGLIEKTLRSGKIKINKKKVKSSFKIKTNDKVDIFNFDFKEEINLKVKYEDFQEINQQLIPSKMTITINEKQNNTLIKLNLKSVSLNQSIRFPFKLPKGYKLLNF